VRTVEGGGGWRRFWLCIDQLIECFDAASQQKQKQQKQQAKQVHWCAHVAHPPPRLRKQPNTPTGNKADLESARAVTAEEAQAYANEAGLFFLETSAKTAANVNELFAEIARKLPKAEAGPRQPQGGIVLDSAPAQQPKKSSCCSA